MSFRLLTDGTIECGTVDDVLALRERMQRPASPPSPLPTPPEEDPEVRKRMSARVRARMEVVPELMERGYTEEVAVRAVGRAIATIPNGSLETLRTMTETLAAAEVSATAKPTETAKAAPRALPGRRAAAPEKAAPAVADESLADRLSAAGFRRSANGAPAIPQKLAALLHATPTRTFSREELSSLVGTSVNRVSDALIRLKHHKFAESRGRGLYGAYRGNGTAKASDDDAEGD